MIYQLNYRSKAISSLILEDLDQILQTAKNFNENKNITGCLIYHGGHFVQILEGNKKDLLELYKTIQKDQRHSQTTLLWEAFVEKRYFSDWNMAYYNPAETNLQQFTNNLLLLSQFSDKSSASLLSFWTKVGEILRNDNTKAFVTGI